MKKLSTWSLEHIILQRQLLFLGKLARRDASDCLRSFVFTPGTFTLAQPEKRKQGRPRLQWSTEVMKHAARVVAPGSFQHAILDAQKWRQSVSKYCASLATNA